MGPSWKTVVLAVLSVLRVLRVLTVLMGIAKGADAPFSSAIFWSWEPPLRNLYDV
jgi:hypothetical protein